MMKDINTISSAVIQSLQRPVSLQDEEYKKVPSTIDIELINWLIKILMAILPAHKIAIYNAEILQITKQEWLVYLPANGINTYEKMLIGIAKARRPETGPYFPKPSIFCEWCQPGPGDFDFPCINSAYSEAISHRSFPETYKWSHVVVEWAAMEAKLNGFLTTGFSDDKIKFIKYYNLAITHISNGVNLSLPLREYKVLIESKSSKSSMPSTQERSAQEIANIRKKLKSTSRFPMNNRSLATV